MEEFESFFDDVKEVNSVLWVSIPFKLVQAVKLKKGDRVKVLIRKI